MELGRDQLGDLAHDGGQHRCCEYPQALGPVDGAGRDPGVVDLVLRDAAGALR